MKAKWRRVLLGGLAVVLLAGCTETRVIRDNTLDAKFGRSMGAGNVQRAGQVGTSSSSFH